MKKTIYMVCFLLSTCTAAMAQTIPFAIINDKDGYTNIRYGKSKKVIDKIYNNQVFAIRSIVDDDGWQDWYWMDYPDYRQAKKTFEKFIHKTKEGMIHQSRIMKLTDLPQWKNRHQDSLLICSKGTASITIRYGLFNRTEHRYTQSTDGIYHAIDGIEPWGIDGDIPDGMTEIKSIILEQKGKQYTFPKEAIKNLFLPNTGLGNFGVAEASDHLFLYMSNSDGAGSYDVVWTIKESKVISQFLYRSF